MTLPDRGGDSMAAACARQSPQRTGGSCAIRTEVDIDVVAIQYRRRRSTDLFFAWIGISPVRRNTSICPAPCGPS